jgi:succinylglutamate desuccinylase
LSEQNGDTGSKDRATVALVYRTVDDLGKAISAEFRAVNARLDTFMALPAAVAAQHEMITMLQARMFNAEQRLSEAAKREETRTEDEQDRAEAVTAAEAQWRREKRPLLLLAGVSTLVSLAALAASFIPH